MAEKELIIKVDKDDNELGLEDKWKCHEPKGILHRAFVIGIFNENNELLLTRRSDSKKLWDGFWDGSVASHPHAGETYETAAVRRVEQELGLSLENVKYLFKFEYHVPYKDIGSENEICAFLIARTSEQPKPAPDEISEMKFLPLDRIKADVKANPGIYCPWFTIILEKLADFGMDKELSSL